MKAEGTQTNYKQYFQKFTEFVNMTADELLTQRIQDSTSTNMQTKFRFENIFIQFLADCKTKGYENGTLQSIYAAIRSFFDIHRYPLAMRKTDYPKSTANGVRRATDTAILEILEENNISLTAKILTAKDTGLGASDLVKLNCGIILENPAKNLIMITGKRTKTNDLYKTFIGEEAIDALKTYIDQRKKGTRFVKPETITPKTPLFITKKGTRLSRECMSSNIQQAFLRHGEKHMSAHSLRKRLQTKLSKGNMPTNWIDLVLGHQLINSRDAYELPTDEELTEAYQNAYHEVKITPQMKPLQTHQQQPDIIEATTIEQARTALANGYTYAGNFNGTTLYQKPTTIQH